MRFSYTVVHVPGKDLHIADTLSRAPQATLHPNDTELQEEISCYVAEVMTTLPASDKKLEEIRIHQDEDEICRQIKVFCHEGWPAKHQLSGPLEILATLRVPFGGRGTSSLLCKAGYSLISSAFDPRQTSQGSSGD